MEGETLGTYKIEKTLGQGAVGTVYLAHGKDGPVALKVLHPFTVPATTQRFRREARILEQLDHPAFARFIESGTFPSPDGERPFLASEYISGKTLREHFEESDRGLDQKVQILIELCAAMQYAHEAGVIHRDLKPENIIIEESTGLPHIVDFGIARWTDVHTQGTTEGDLLGTVRYMSPEQARGTGTEIDIRSDVYTLGVIGYEMITGTLPYGLDNPTMHQLAVSILTVEPLPLVVEGTGVVKDLDRVLHRALQKDPDSRQATADELRKDLIAAVEGQTLELARRGLVRTAGRVARSPKRRAVMLGTLVVAVAAAIFLGRLAISDRTAHEFVTPGPALLEVFNDIEDARRLVHTGSRTVERIAAADSILRATLPRIWSAEEPYAGLVQLLVDSRLSEANYILGYMTDRAEYHIESLGFSTLGDSIQVDKESLRFLDARYPIHAELLTLGAHGPVFAQGNAHASIAQYRSPARNLRLGEVLCENALSIFDGTLEAPWWKGDPLPSTSGRSLSHARAGMLNGLGWICAQRGFVEDDLVFVDYALRYLAAADTVPAFRSNRSAYASLHFNAGVAWGTRYGLTLEAADWDSALVRLNRALEIRTPSYSSEIHGVTRSELARLRLRLAKVSDSKSIQSEQLERALEDAAVGVESVSRTHTPAQYASVVLPMADALTQMGFLQNAPALLDSADAMIEESLAGLEALEAREVPRAELLLARAEVAAARWRLDPVAQEYDFAQLRALEAQGSIAKDQYPSLHRRIQELLAALRPDPN